jgi:hypothetical protein
LRGLRRPPAPVADVQILQVNGQPAARLSLDGQEALTTLEVRDGKIAEILTVLNPDKLSYLHRQSGAPAAGGG